MRLLLVEDDRVMGRALRQSLRESGWKCLWARDGLRALALARHPGIDAIILDLMLPGCGGLEMLRQLRVEGIKVPILVATALGTVEERVAGLNAGADDYLVKPFSVAELLARLTAVFRRTTVPTSSVLEVGALRLDLEGRTVQRAGQPIELTPTQFTLLELLVRYAGQVVTRKMLCEHLWQGDWDGGTNVIDVHVKNLRARLDRGFDQTLIQTVRGRGYSLVAP